MSLEVLGYVNTCRVKVCIDQHDYTLYPLALAHVPQTVRRLVEPAQGRLPLGCSVGDGVPSADRLKDVGQGVLLTPYFDIVWLSIPGRERVVVGRRIKGRFSRFKIILRASKAGLWI